jgi:hypothetical protein
MRSTRRASPSTARASTVSISRPRSAASGATVWRQRVLRLLRIRVTGQSLSRSTKPDGLRMADLRQWPERIRPDPGVLAASVGMANQVGHLQLQDTVVPVPRCNRNWARSMSYFVLDPAGLRLDAR